MDRVRASSSMLFVLLLIIRASDASTRTLLADDKPTAEKVSPSPAPNSSLVNKDSSQNQLPKSAASPPDSGKPSEKKSDDPSPMPKTKNEEKNERKDDKMKAGDGPLKNPEEGSIDKSRLEECDGFMKCRKRDFIACLQHSENGTKDLVIIAQNAGETTLDVNVLVPPSIATDVKMLSLAKHSTKKVSISVGSTTNLTIVLNAGTEECSFQIGMAPSVSDWIQQFPAYARQLPPMYGAYFLFFALVIAGGIWGCCKFRNRGRRAVDGVAYQQLEMGALSQSAAETIESSAADGWEQSWDDDWDDEEATVRPSTTSANGHISSNGLSSRSTNRKNDWDTEWDD